MPEKIAITPYAGAGMFGGETIGQAAEGWAGWCRARGNEMLAEFIEKMAKDGKRLDFLDAKGVSWVARESGTGRGYRVHQYYKATAPSARAAIDAAMEGK